VLRIPLIGPQLESGLVDRALVIAVFVVPPASIFLYLVLREWLLWKRWRRASQATAEAERAEGFPPPDPPTTDSQAP
jgi:hypothetical protein